MRTQPLKAVLGLPLAGIVCSLAEAQCDWSIPFQASFYVERPAGGVFTVNYVEAVAWVVAFDVGSDCFDPQYCNVADIDSSFSSDSAFAEAYWQETPACFDTQMSNVAEASALSGCRFVPIDACGVWIETLRAHACFNNWYGPGQPCDSPGGSIAFAAAEADFWLSVPGNLVTEVSIANPTVPPVSREFVVMVNGPLSIPAVLGTVIRTMSGDLVSGLVLNGAGDAWELNTSQSLAASQPVSLDVVGVSLVDENLDVDGDGRPASADISALQAVVGTSAATDPTYGPHDVDADGVITQNDVDVLDLIIEVVANAKQYQDVNDDGAVSCSDLPVVIPSSGSVVSDADYEVAVDEDLDGTITLEERREFLLDLQPADANLNGSIDSSDYFAWVNAFGVGDPAADANRNGTVDSSDYFAWVSAFNSPC